MSSAASLAFGNSSHNHTRAPTSCLRIVHCRLRRSRIRVCAIPVIGWLVQIPFYFLELLVGLVQALVFTLLTAVFTLLICQQHEEHPAAAPHGSH